MIKKLLELLKKLGILKTSGGTWTKEEDRKVDVDL